MELMLEQFSGPLDLLLQLIAEEKLDISEVSLARVTEQYMLYIEQVEDDRADEIADFLVVGARLVLIKSKILVADLEIDDESDGPRLEDQLKRYQQFVAVSKLFEKKWYTPQFAIGRMHPAQTQKSETLPQNVTTKHLLKNMLQLVDRLRPPKPLPSTTIDATVSLKQKIEVIHQMLKNKRSFRFRDIIDNSSNKTEMIVGFLAILELMKQHSLEVHQTRTFGEVHIRSIVH